MISRMAAPPLDEVMMHPDVHYKALRGSTPDTTELGGSIAAILALFEHGGTDLRG